MNEDGKAFLRLDVTDEGPGFPPAEKSRIATPYLRFQGCETVPGTGLGLTVVQKVLQAHRGRLDVANNEAAPARRSRSGFPRSAGAPVHPSGRE